MNSYINPYNYLGREAKYYNTQNTYMLDKQTGDVNGDTIPDIVYLVGEKGEGPYY